MGPRYCAFAVRPKVYLVVSREESSLCSLSCNETVGPIVMLK